MTHRARIAAAFYASVKRFCHATGLTESELAKDLSVSAGHLSNMMHDVAPIPAHIITGLFEITGDASVLEALCELADRHCIAVETTPGEGSVLRLIEDYTAAARESSEALADGVVTDAECERCQGALHVAITAALSLAEALRLWNRKTTRQQPLTLADAELMETANA